MSQPPFQPGQFGEQPGGQPQQPGGHPQQGGFPAQQGGFPQQQPGGFPQQGAFPQPGGDPQAGYPQQPGGDPQAGYPQQQAGYPPQGGQPQPGWAPHDAPKKRGSLPWILVGGGVLVVGVVVTLILTLGGNSPDGAAKSFITALRAGDVNAANALICDEKDRLPAELFEKADQDRAEISDLTITSVDEQGDKATVKFEATDSNGKKQNGTIKVRNKDGDWCVEI
jgi:uncharacterized protein YxeA